MQQRADGQGSEFGASWAERGQPRTGRSPTSYKVLPGFSYALRAVARHPRPEHVGAPPIQLVIAAPCETFFFPLRRAGLENPPLKHGPRQVLLFTGSFLVGTRDVVAAVLASVKLRFAEIGAPPCRADAAGRPSRSSAPLLHLLGYTKQKQSKFRGGSSDCRARCRHSVVVRAADIRLARRSVPFLAA